MVNESNIKGPNRPAAKEASCPSGAAKVKNNNNAASRRRRPRNDGKPKAIRHPVAVSTGGELGMDFAVAATTNFCRIEDIICVLDSQVPEGQISSFEWCVPATKNALIESVLVKVSSTTPWPEGCAVVADVPFSFQHFENELACWSATQHLPHGKEMSLPVACPRNRSRLQIGESHVVLFTLAKTSCVPSLRVVVRVIHTGESTTETASFRMRHLDSAVLNMHTGPEPKEHILASEMLTSASSRLVMYGAKDSPLQLKEKTAKGIYASITSLPEHAVVESPYSFLGVVNKERVVARKMALLDGEWTLFWCDDKAVRPTDRRDHDCSIDGRAVFRRLPYDCNTPKTSGRRAQTRRTVAIPFSKMDGFWNVASVVVKGSTKLLSQKKTDSSGAAVTEQKIVINGADATENNDVSGSSA